MPAGHAVVAPDKVKGSLTAPQVAAHVAAELRRFMPTVDVRLAPVADGGDGLLEAVAACGCSLVPVAASGPTGEPVDAAFARRGSTAVIELAEASGLRRLPDGALDAMHASSRGTGEVVRAALDAGCDQIIVYALTILEPDSSVCIRDAGRRVEKLAAAVVAPEWLGGVLIESAIIGCRPRGRNTS